MNNIKDALKTIEQLTDFIFYNRYDFLSHFCHKDAVDLNGIYVNSEKCKVYFILDTGIEAEQTININDVIDWMDRLK